MEGIPRSQFQKKEMEKEKPKLMTREKEKRNVMMAGCVSQYECVLYQHFCLNQWVTRTFFIIFYATHTGLNEWAATNK
jgi:hypothetical protein